MKLPANKHISKKNIIYRLIMLIGVITVLVNIMLVSYVNSCAALGDIGEPRSSFDLGTARMLDGSNLIITVYVDTPGCVFTDKDINAYQDKINTACEYLKSEAGKNGKKVSFILDDSELNYRIFLSKQPDESDESTDYVDAAIENIKRNVIARNITGRNINVSTMAYYGSGIDPEYEHGYARLLKRYNADNIFMILCFISYGRSYAICYDGIDSEYESLVMFNDSPCVLAHEILHLYGAHDYYSGAEYTENTVKYISDNYPNDIMLSVDEGNKILKEIGALTRYHLGWIDSVDGLDEYPELTR